MLLFITMGHAKCLPKVVMRPGLQGAFLEVVERGPYLQRPHVLVGKSPTASSTARAPRLAGMHLGVLLLFVLQFPLGTGPVGGIGHEAGAWYMAATMCRSLFLPVGREQLTPGLPTSQSSHSLQVRPFPPVGKQQSATIPSITSGETRGLQAQVGLEWLRLGFGELVN